jgi:uncharacterized protein YbjT (DUF2867 family)
MEAAQEVLVTGGTGTLGRRLVERLRERDREVRVMSRGGRPGTAWGDLLTGEGVGEAVRGVGTVVHLATDPRKARRADVGGTERLLREAAAAGVRHFVYVSVVGADRNPFSYYRAKLDAERAVERSEVPWTLLRSTQFHEFVLGLLGSSDRLPFAVVPKGFLLQPVDAGEVAGRLVELALSEPAGRVPDFGGPEVRTAAQLARSYRGAKGLGKGVLEVPVPGGAARAFREGAQVAPGSARGTISWEEFLRRTIPVRAAEARGASA